MFGNFGCVEMAICLASEEYSSAVCLFSALSRVYLASSNNGNENNNVLILLLAAHSILFHLLSWCVVRCMV